MITSSIAPRLHSLDGVRAVAVTLVVLHHLGASDAAHKLSGAGHALAGSLLSGVTAGGVELFFVLSGVVLARPYLRAGRPMNISSYFSRRVKRLFPPFFFAWLVSGLSIYLASYFPTWWTRAEFLPHFDVIDWLKQIGILYWGTRPFNFAWWSLSTEILFYLIFPFSIPFFRHVPESRVIAFFLFGITVITSVFAFAHPVFFLPAFNKLLVYSSCFCAGMLLAAVDFTTKVPRGLAVAGILWVLCASYFVEVNPHVGWGLLAFALVCLASEHNSAIERLLSKPIFVWLGERSYSIFLTHFAVIVLVYHGVSVLIASKGAIYFLATRVIAILLILFTAMLLFHFVERRFAKNLVTANAFWPWSASSKTMAVFAGAA